MRAGSWTRAGRAGLMVDAPTVRRRGVVLATVTPLASILGSGLLIVVPVLERTLGALSILGILGVCGVAWLVGTSVRHCVRVVEPAAEDGTLDPLTRRLDEAGDAVIVVAYVISVALYLRIMAAYVVGYAGGGSDAERVLACAAVAVIVAVGVVRGFAGLDLLDRVSLGTVLVLTLVLGAVLLVHDGRGLLHGTVSMPPVPGVGIGKVLLVLGGITITVQGFETVRFLGEDYDTETRVRASRLAQGAATVIYVGIVLVATPVMGLGTAAGADPTLLEITSRVAPLLSLPLVVSAVLSQFSAAVADTAAADGNLRLLWPPLGHTWSFLLSGAAAIALAATVETYTIVAVASRAFAAYYALQALLAFRTCTGRARRLGYAVLGVLMLAIALLALPAG